jgi:hypothetical protein
VVTKWLSDADEWISSLVVLKLNLIHDNCHSKKRCSDKHMSMQQRSLRDVKEKDMLGGNMYFLHKSLK